jgi:glucose-1-phosphate cytidylyltransferase
MKIYLHHGISDFIVCLGYKGFVIKEFFVNYETHMSDLRLDFAKHERQVLRRFAEPWSVTLVDTGQDTMTGGRLKRVRHLLGDEDFCFTYGDGVGDVNIKALIAQHKQTGHLATLTSAHPPGRFGLLTMDGHTVKDFREKPHDENSYVNAGFFVMNPKALDYVDDDSQMWEHQPMERLVRENQLAAYRHDGFWQPRDTLRDKRLLQDMWESGKAPWRTWD